jgi:hypothetical protein
VFSDDLRSAAEVWHSKEESTDISLDNGIMLAAIVAKKLYPEDLWFSMETNQQALIPPVKWRKFCDKYGYEQKVNWARLNKNEEECDTIKIN